MNPIPRMRYLNTGPMLPMADMGAAMQRGRALKEMGDAVRHVGEKAMDLMGRSQAMRDVGRATSFRANLDEDFAKFEAGLMTRSDTENWLPELKQWVGKRRAELAKQGLSPAGMQRAQIEFDQWVSDANVKMTKTTALRNVMEAKARHADGLNYSTSRGDEAGVMAHLAKLPALGYSPAEQQQIERTALGELSKHRWQEDIEADAQGALERLKSPAFLEQNPHLTLEDREALERQADQTRREHTADMIDAAQNAMASGKLTDPRQLETQFGGAPPVVLEKLRNELAARTDAAEQRRRATPEYQAEAVGRATRLISEWEMKSDDYDAGYADIVSLLDQVEDPGAKAALQEQLGVRKAGQKAKLETSLDLARNAVKEARKAGRFGKEKPEAHVMTLGALLDDGALRSKERLMSGGFSEKQAEKIIEAADAKDMTHKAQIRKFLELYPQREGEAGQASPMTRALFDALRGRSTLSSEVVAEDPELLDAKLSAEAEADERMGKALLELEAFARANPNATKKEYDEEVYRIAGKEARESMRRQMIPPAPKPEAPQGAFPETSMVPQGENLLEIVRHFEAGGAPGGYHAEAYWDYGQWSIGYGTKSKPGERISKEEAENRLQSELSKHRERVVREAARVGLALSPHELDALTSFDYNTGSIETLLAGGRRSKAEIAEKMLLYRNAGGKRLRGLENRRRAEQALFVQGYPQSTAAR